MKRLLIAALGCAACMAPAAAMATTAEITATGTIPSACNVEGANIAMNIVGFDLIGEASNLNFFGSIQPVFYLSRPTVTRVDSKPGAASVAENAVGTIAVNLDPALGQNGVLQLSSDSQSNQGVWTPGYPNSFGTATGSITAKIERRTTDVLVPGDYTVSATLSCFTD